MLGGSVAHRIEESKYKSALFAMKDIIYLEKGSNEKNIEIYNAIFDLIEGSDKEYVFRESLQYKIFKLSKIFIGYNASYKFMVFLKNIFAM